MKNKNLQHIKLLKNVSAYFLNLNKIMNLFFLFCAFASKKSQSKFLKMFLKSFKN